MNTGGSHRLDKVVDFLNRYPQRTALIEGYGDSMGSDQHGSAADLQTRHVEVVIETGR